MYHVGVYKQSDTFTTEFEVRKDLGLMDRGDAVDRLDFHHHEVLDDQVHSITEIELDSPIDDGKAKLSGISKSSLPQFVLQTCGVGAFE
jgi:hypothetical protein